MNVIWHENIMINKDTMSFLVFLHEVQTMKIIGIAIKKLTAVIASVQNMKGDIG